MDHVTDKLLVNIFDVNCMHVRKEKKTLYCRNNKLMYIYKYLYYRCVIFILEL